MSIAITVDHEGRTYLGEVGKVERTLLGYEDHGIFTLYLYLDFAGSSQGAGGYFLDDYDKEKDCRIPTLSGMRWIMEVMACVGAREWENVKGTTLVALREEPYGAIKGLARLDGSRVLIFADIAKD